MAVRFRKSVKIGKSAKVNFSKSGMSLSAGMPGFSVNTGKRGTYLNTGVPGTGFYSRTKVGGVSSGKKGSNSQSQSGAKSNPEREYALKILTSHQVEKENGRADLVSINIDTTTGDVKYLFPDNKEEITDPSVIRVLKTLPEYKASLQRIRAEQQRIWSEVKSDTDNATEDFVNIFKLAPEVYTSKDVKSQIELLEIKTYEKRVFPKPEPTQQEIKEALRLEAEKSIKSFLGKKKKREQYCVENYPTFYREYMSLWTKEKTAFEKQELETEQQKNKEYLNEYKTALHAFETKLVCDDVQIQENIETWLGELSVPAEMSAQVEYDKKMKTVFIDLDLPEIEDMPDKIATVLKSGQVKLRDKTQKKLREDYAQCVFGLAVFMSSSVFNINMNIESIVISGYTQRRDKNGDIQYDYIYSVKINRDHLVHKKISDPKEFFLSCENRIKMSQTFVFKAIEPFDFVSE